VAVRDTGVGAVEVAAHLDQVDGHVLAPPVARERGNLGAHRLHVLHAPWSAGGGNEPPLKQPLRAATTIGLVFELMLLICGGAKGTRTPGLLHAMRIRSVDPRPAQSNGEPPICTNTPR